MITDHLSEEEMQKIDALIKKQEQSQATMLLIRLTRQKHISEVYSIPNCIEFIIRRAMELGVADKEYPSY